MSTSSYQLLRLTNYRYTAAVERVRVCDGAAEAIGALVAGVEEDLAGVGVTPVREEDAWWRVVGRLGEPMSSPSSTEDSN